MPVARYNSGVTWNTPGLTYGPAAPPAGAQKRMKQNLISLGLTDQQWTDLDTALTTVETLMGTFIDLTPDQRQDITKMGDKSEAFCRQCITVLAQNPGVLPGNFNLAELQADLANLDKVRVRLTRLQQATEKADDTEMALGSDIMVGCLEGYAQLKVSGLGAGLDELRRQMRVRFDRPNDQDEPTPPAPTP